MLSHGGVIGASGTPAASSSVTQLGSGSVLELIFASTGNLTKDSGTTAGDLALIFVSWYEPEFQTVGTPSGFTKVDEWRYVVYGNDYGGMVLFARACDGSEGASYTVSFSPNAVYANALLMTLRGNGALTLSSATRGSVGSATTTATAPAVTGSAGQCLVAAFAAEDNCTMSTPSGMTPGPAATQNNNAAAFFLENLSASGSTGTRTSTLSVARTNAALSILINNP